MGLQLPPHTTLPTPPPTPAFQGLDLLLGQPSTFFCAIPGLAVDFGSLQSGRVTGAKAKSQMLLALTSCGFRGLGGGSLHSLQ